jgi:hypothetical protein
VAENSLILLFLKEKVAEEIKLTFQKAKTILAFSFLFGDDFNFFIATNISIDLYKIKLDKKESKLVKNIILQVSDPLMQVHYEPLANLVVITDSKGLCSPFFLNLYKQKQHRGKIFQLDTTVAGGEDNAGGAGRASLSERAMSFFKKIQTT